MSSITLSSFIFQGFLSKQQHEYKKYSTTVHLYSIVFLRKTFETRNQR